MSVQDVQDLTKRGRMFLRDGKFKDAVDILRTALEMDSEYTPAYNLLGIALGRLREWKKSLSTFRKGLALDRDNPVLRFNYAITFDTKGQQERAPGQYRGAIRNHPGWLDAMNALGLVLFKQGEYSAANRTFSRILKLDPSNAEALNNKGLVLADQGRNKEAIKKYRSALELDPRYIKAALNLARALEDTGNFPDALEELERLADLAPSDWDVRTRLAGLYQKLERYDDAMDQARAVLEKDPENIQALRIEGAVQGIQGNDEDAKNIFEKITTLAPAEENDDIYNKFMIESAESRYCLDIVPPPAAQPKLAPPKPVKAKPAPEALPEEPALPDATAATEATLPEEPALPEAAVATEAALPEEPILLEESALPEAADAIEAALPEEPALSEAADAIEAALPEEPALPDAVVATEAALPEEPTLPDAADDAGPIGEAELLGLMRYLMSLTESLPEPELNDFMHSDAHMEMKYIIDILENPNG
jgi:tetratricopeptide (TPR) repeat protein